MTYKEIQDLINLVAKSNLSEVKLKDGEFSLIIRSKDFGAYKAAAPIHMTTSQPMNMAQPMVDNSTHLNKESTQQKSTEAPKEEVSKPVDAVPEGKYIEFKSPMVGTFYRSAGPDKPAFAQVGDQVSKGQTVCIIEAMKLFNEIESEFNGKIVKVMVDDATPVEYDQVLFLIDPKG